MYLEFLGFYNCTLLEKTNSGILIAPSPLATMQIYLLFKRREGGPPIRPCVLYRNYHNNIVHIIGGDMTYIHTIVLQILHYKCDEKDPSHELTISVGSVIHN